MRKVLLLTACLIVAWVAACQSKVPVGPGTVTVTQTTSTTTSTIAPSTTTTSLLVTTSVPVQPGASARRYVTFQGPPNIPRDMSLFFQLISPAASAPAMFGRRGLRLQPQADISYSVVGIYVTGSGIGGAVKGVLGGSATPLDNGQFDGTLTAEFTGCTAERQFSGPISSQVLQWTAGRGIKDCAASSLPWPDGFTLLRTDAPPTATTSALPNATTTVPAAPTPTTTTIAATPITSARYQGTVTPSGGQPIPADLSLFFQILGGLTPTRSGRVIGLAAPTYSVTGGYTTGPNSFGGSITGTLDGSPENGLFNGVMTANIPNCTARRNYSGTLSSSGMNWNPGANIDSCGGNSPLTFGISAPKSSSPATSTSSVASTTTAFTTTSSSTTTSTTEFFERP
jgi:hypothetical protein